MQVFNSLRTIHVDYSYSDQNLMNISPALLLLMLVIFVFSPSIQEWVTQGGTAWYRPYQAWLVVIVFIYWTQRRYNERKQEEKDSNEL